MKATLLSLLVLASMLWAMPAAAQDQATTTTRAVPMLSVTGTSQVQARPDLAMVSLGVQTQAPRVADAISQNNQAMSKVVAAIRGAGVPERDIQTATFNVSPIYTSRPSPTGEGEQQLVGYRVTNTVTVRLEDMNKVGTVIDAGTAAGANQVYGISFQLRDDLAARTQALGQAAKEAQAKARALAEAMGVRLGPVLTVNEQGAEVRPLVTEVAFARAAAPGVPISSGRVTVTASVSVTYRLGE